MEPHRVSKAIGDAGLLRSSRLASDGTVVFAVDVGAVIDGLRVDLRILKPFRCRLSRSAAARRLRCCYGDRV